MGSIFENGECVVYVAEIGGRFKRGGAFFEPFLFMVRQEDVGEGGTQRGTHGYPVLLGVVSSVKDEKGVTYYEFQKCMKIRFAKIVKGFVASGK